MFWNSKDNKENENDVYNSRSHQDSYFIDVFDRRNNFQYCRFCDCHRHFEYDRCSHCKNN